MMLVSGKRFSGDSRLADIHNAVSAKAGLATWFSEFTPATRPDKEFMEALLWVFHAVGICCAVVGEYASYMSGVFATSDDVDIYVAYPLERKNDAAALLLRERHATDPTKFSLYEFTFELLLDRLFEPCEYMEYRVRWGDMENVIKIRCVDSLKPCGLRSNIDLVHFVWDSLVYYFLNYAITVGPCSPNGKVMYLCHYRAASNGRGSRACRACEEMMDGIYEVELQCVAPGQCSCIACRKQPPSLKASASEIVFRYLYDLPNFRFDQHTTYDLYSYVVNKLSDLSSVHLCPFQIPHTLVFKYYFTDLTSRRQYHEQCVTAVGPSQPQLVGTCRRRFTSRSRFVMMLITAKERLWCSHCEKVLFDIPHEVSCIRLRLY
jgi:hypothetical protein